MALGLWLALASLSASCAPRVQPTASLYDLRLATVDGDLYDLGARRGKVTLVNFFATWCFPCLVEMPELAAMHRRFQGKGFSVVAIGVDLEGAKVIKPFADFNRLPFPVLVADDALRAGETPFGKLRALPSNVLLDADGKVVLAYEGVAEPKQIEKAVERLLE